MTASTLAFPSASSNRAAVATPSAVADARASSEGSTASTGAMTVLFNRVLRIVFPHHPRPTTAALIIRPSEFRHLGPVPVADFARSHQRDAVMAHDIVEQRFQIFDAMRNPGNVRM